MNIDCISDHVGRLADSTFGDGAALKLATLTANTEITKTGGNPENIAPGRFHGEQCRRFLDLIMKPGTCTELSVLKARYGQGGYIEGGDAYLANFSGSYDSVDHLLADAGRVKGVNVFVTPNPVKSDLLARLDNKIGKSKSATSDEDIACLRWIHVDVDAVRPTNISAMNSELEFAFKQRDLIFQKIPETNPCSIWGQTGNGAFILVRLDDIANEPENRARVVRFIEIVAARYPNKQVTIDTTTSNPAR